MYYYNSIDILSFQGLMEEEEILADSTHFNDADIVGHELIVFIISVVTIISVNTI